MYYWCALFGETRRYGRISFPVRTKYDQTGGRRAHVRISLVMPEHDDERVADECTGLIADRIRGANQCSAHVAPYCMSRRHMLVVNSLRNRARIALLINANPE